jgi:transcriptional regulator with XRE-family HTH domain
LGEHIKKRRLDLGLLQREVAEQLGVNKFTVLNWERGKTSPDVRYYPAIIDFLGYNPRPIGETFAERLRAAREARGLSRKRLARELGVWETTVRDWEVGIHKPSPRLKQRLLELLPLEADGAVERTRPADETRDARR